MPCGRMGFSFTFPGYPPNSNRHAIRDHECLAMTAWSLLVWQTLNLTRSQELSKFRVLGLSCFISYWVPFCHMSSFANILLFGLQVPPNSCCHVALGKSAVCGGCQLSGSQPGLCWHPCREPCQQREPQCRARQ